MYYRRKVDNVDTEVIFNFISHLYVIYYTFQLQQEALLMQRNRASTLSVEIV